MNRMLILAHIFLGSFLTGFAQQDKFTAHPLQKDVRTLYTYKKSNWDGTHASTIFLYISDHDRLESFKWSPGDEWATLVTAVIDWNTFTVKMFTNHRIFKDGRKQLIAELHQRDKGLYFTIGSMSDSMKLDHSFWHSYDFDFAGLGFIWRALKDKTAGFWFHIADAGMANGKVGFLNKGTVDVNFEGMEAVNGRDCYKYRINGPGLQNRGGFIWINSMSEMIEQYKIELPDEEGFDNGLLKLENTEKMTNAEWGRFIIKKMKE